MNRAVSSDIEALRAALAVAQARADEAEAKALEATAKAKRAVAEVSNAEAIIAALKLQIERLRREIYGQRSERKARLLDQLELELEELEASASEDELAAEQAAARTSTVKSFTRKRPSRKPFPDHLPRERVVIPAPEVCACCGSDRLSKLGEDITETLEVIPRQWKVIQTVREKFTCRDCERISQPPAPFHVTPRGWAGPSLLAMILFEKYGQHQPLNRQSERYGREGVALSLSTLADQVGACATVLRPLHDLIATHVLAAERIHGDDTTVPVLAKGKAKVARAWVYVRDDAPFGGTDPPAALFHYSRDRSGEHPEKHLTGFAGILQADAYAGYNRLYSPGRSPGSVTEALCWSHARRKFFVLADIAASARRGAKTCDHLTAGLRSREADRRAVRHRAGDQRKDCARAVRCPSRAICAAAHRSRGPDARRTRAALPPCPGRQGHGLHAQAMARLYPVSRRWPDLSHQQRSRAGLARDRARQEGLAVRRLRPWRSQSRPHVHPDRHGEDERRRSSGLARRRARPHRRASVPAPPRTPALELEAGPGCRHTGRITHTAKSEFTAALTGWLLFRYLGNFAT